MVQEVRTVVDVSAGGSKFVPAPGGGGVRHDVAADRLLGVLAEHRAGVHRRRHLVRDHHRNPELVGQPGQVAGDEMEVDR